VDIRRAGVRYGARRTGQEKIVLLDWAWLDRRSPAHPTRLGVRIGCSAQRTLIGGLA